MYNVEFTNDDQEIKFFKLDSTINDPIIIMQTNYFWKLLNDIDKPQKEKKTNDYNSSQYMYLCPFKRVLFYNSPVALLFAGGAQDSKSQYYTDKINCCLLTHHLCEMGYQQDDIMCFVEGDIFESSLLPPFTANQIRISKEMILCSYYTFKTYLGFIIFEGSLNNPSIFLFAII